MPEPLSDAALVELVAERVMGANLYAYHNGGVYIIGPSPRGWRRFDPLNDDRDFGALLDKCAERGWRPDLLGDTDGWEACLYLGDGDWKAVRDPSRRRAVVRAAAAAVRAEGETKP